MATVQAKAPTSDSPYTTDFYNDFGLSAPWGERVITAVAIALAITLVASVALLMGTG